MFGVERIANALERIAVACEHMAHLPMYTSSASSASSMPMPPVTFSESAEDYEQRVQSESDAAIRAGYAPWSADVLRAMEHLRSELMQPGVETDAQGKVTTRRAYTWEEATQVIAEALDRAKVITDRNDRERNDRERAARDTYTEPAPAATA